MRATVIASGLLTMPDYTARAALGRGGVRMDKTEGDGATPVGVLPLRLVYFRPDKMTAPKCAVPVQALAPHHGWCDDPTQPDYNRAVVLPFGGSAEALWRSDDVYDIIGVLGWNDDPVIAGHGSAIFLHVARPDYAPTEGCVALAAPDLRTVLSMGLTEIDVRPP
jgi:L,D-peptidoglycan transpeptidase YkuD (ErfK/YbiS/YcfS/YnhG family)